MSKILIVISSVVERSRFLHFGRNDIFILVCVTVSLFSCVTTVHAQSVSLSVSPPVVEILLAPNKKATQTFNLGYSGENLTATPEIHLIKPEGLSGHVTIDPSPLIPSSIPLSIISQGHPLNIPFELSGTSTPLTLTFEAASSDISQDLYLALVFKVSSSDSPLNRLSQSTPAISALILVTITPTGVLPINLEIKDFTLPLIHDSWLPLSPSPTLTNNSDIMIRPIGTYEILSPTGKTVFSLPLYPNLLLGNSSRKIEGQRTESETIVNPIPLTWSPQWSSIGPYRIKLTVTSLGGTKISEIEKVVWILPLRIIIILTILAITIGVLYKTKKTKIAI